MSIPPQPTLNPPIESAADRRRKAIMAAMSQNFPPPTTTTATATSTSSSVPTTPSLTSSSTPSTIRSSSHSLPSAQRLGPTQPQMLPTLPEMSTLANLGRKRELPWDEELSFVLLFPVLLGFDQG